MIRIRGGSGLGDALYLRAVCEHFLRQGEAVEACSDYPGVFDGSGMATASFRRNEVDRVAHYTMGKGTPNTNQWQDICAFAGVGEIPLRIDWTLRNQALVDRLRAQAAGRPLVLVHGGRVPMNRSDGFGKELLPRKAAVDTALAELADCFLVQIGQAAQLYPLAVGMNLNGSTSVADLLDVASICDGAVGQCSFIIPLCEVFDKPLLCVWAAHGMQANMHQYIRSITPQKVLSKPTSRFVVDDWAEDKIREAVRAFRFLV